MLNNKDPYQLTAFDNLKNGFLLIFLGILTSLIAIGGILIFIGGILVILGFDALSKTKLEYSNLYKSTFHWMLYTVALEITLVLILVIGTLTNFNLTFILLIIFIILILLFSIITVYNIFKSFKALSKETEEKGYYTAANLMLAYIALNVLITFVIVSYLITATSGVLKLGVVGGLISGSPVILIFSFIFFILIWMATYKCYTSSAKVVAKLKVS